jgi:serine/threonine-protein kinase BUR1
MEKFPITAIREIKLLKALSHPNILQLKEMAVERSKGEMEPSFDAMLCFS